MNQPTDWVEKRITQRRTAEAMVSSLAPLRQEAHATEALAHELLVHKIELEMQLEELKEANSALEDARNQYVQFYESAPAGYLTTCAQGIIREANSSVAGILQAKREDLAGQHFHLYVLSRDRERWSAFFNRALQTGQRAQPGIVIALDCHEVTPFQVYVNCQGITSSDKTPLLLITLTDLNEIELAQAEMMRVLTAS